MISVLYVDDEELLLDICKKFLERSGELQIQTESSAKKALLKIQQESFDAIISDYQMPAMDGIEFLKQVRASGNSIPFIIFTGRGREEVAIEALKEGADFYLQKGGDPSAQFAELKNQIKQIVRQRKAESAVFENEQKYRALYESAYDAIFLMVEEKIIDCNLQTERLFGRPREEIIGHTPIDLSPPVQYDGKSSKEEGMKKIQEALKGNPQSFEWRCIGTDGQIIETEVSMNRIEVLSGYMLLSIIRDITSRKRSEEEILRKGEELAASYEELMGAEEELREQYRMITQNEQELRESESKLNAVIQGSPIPQFVINKDHEVMHWNSALAEYSGIRADEVIGSDNHWKAFYPSKRPCLADILVNEEKDSLNTWYGKKEIKEALIPDAYSAVDFFPHMGSEGKYLSFTAALIRDVSGEIIGAVETLEDITEQKKSALALAESEARYRGMIENMQDAFYRSDKEGILIMASPSVLDLLGYDTLEECIGKDIADSFYYNPEERKDFLKAISRTGSVSNFEITLKRRDGTPICVSTFSHIYYGSDGSPAGVEGTFRDITSSKEAEQTLLESEERFRTLFTHANDAIFLHRISKEGEPEAFIEVNESACRQLGYTRDELLTLSPLDIDAPETLDKIHENTSQILLKGHATFETMHLTKNNERIPVEISAHIYEFRGDKVVLSIARDISERKRSEMAIKNANEKLNLLSRITRHDILNQLTILSGYLELSEDVADNPEIIEFIEKEKKSADTILRQILFTRDYQTIGVQSPIWQNLHETISKAAEMHELKEVTLTIEVGQIEIYADPLLEKVFYNLIDNSLRYAANMSKVSFSSIESDTGLTIICSDDGKGVPPEEKENIFNRKYYSNTGFGLFLSREILSITNFSIRETGEYGVGARFEIHIPKISYKYVS